VIPDLEVGSFRAFLEHGVYPMTARSASTPLTARSTCSIVL
jgi:hypothetical protein